MHMINGRKNTTHRWRPGGFRPGSRRLALSLVALLAASAAAFGQVTTPQEDEKKAAVLEKKIKPNIIILPVIYYTPETRLALGAGGVINYRLGNDKPNTRPSSLWLMAVYTTKNQIQLSLKPEIYLTKNRYILGASLKYERFPRDFYGIGDSIVGNAESYTPENFGLHLSVKKKIFKDLFAGIQYHLEKTTIQKVVAGGLLETGDYIGREGGVLSGLGFGLVWDTRDNIFFPRRGHYIQFSADFYNRTFGSDYHYSTTSLDIRNYIPVLKKDVVALQLCMRDMDGDVPFYELAMLGGSTMMRGNYNGKFRDKALLAVQAEFRVPVWKRFGAAVFTGLGNVGPTLRDISLRHLKHSFGGGLRIRLDEKEGTNIRLDYAWGNHSTGLYMTVQEAF
ncbi:MAG: BamA/TamA family outer membrane protein [Acidobacteriota bacterium]